MLVGKQRIAAHRRNRDAEQAGARRRFGLKAPVAVPVFGEQWRGFIGAALDRDDVVAALYRRDEGVIAKPAERQCERLKIVIAHALAGEGEDMVLEPRRADGGNCG